MVGKKDFSAVGKYGNIICEVSCWHRKITIGLLASSAQTLFRPGSLGTPQRFSSITLGAFELIL